MPKACLFLIASALTLAACSRHAGPAASPADAILAANHAATGDLPASGAVEAVYDYAGEGLTGTTTRTFDAATGDYVESQVAGPVAEASGFDGRTPWMRDMSGANTTQEGGDRVQLAVNAAYRNANQWWKPGHGGAAIAYAGRETLDGHPADHLVVTPRGGKRFDAWFDADSHLLRQIAEAQLFFKTRTLFADYGRESGVIVARKVTFDGGTGASGYDHLTLRRLSVDAARPASAYARPTEPPAGASIVGSQASVTVPFRLLNNHIYIQGRINGRGPFNLMVDTGGHTLVSPRTVKEIGLKTEGASSASGMGDKVATSAYVKVREVAIGGVRLRDQSAVALNIYDPEIEGIRVDGMVGFELFRRFAVRVDYANHTLTFTDPARFDPKDAGTPVKFKFYEHLPQVQGEVDGVPALFDIDTGSRAEIDLTAPFVERAHLRAKYPKGADAITGWGVGGAAHAYVVRLPWLSIGGVRADSVVAGLSTAKAGSMSDANFEGNIGSGLLKRFVVTFDYAHQVLYLKPIVPPPVDAGRFDRSGMWINASGGGYQVTYVAEGGPAAEAGLVKGDVITSIDGKPAVAEGLSDARTLLRARPAGARLPIEFRRGQARRTAQIVLRDQI